MRTLAPKMTVYADAEATPANVVGEKMIAFSEDPPHTKKDTLPHTLTMMMTSKHSCPSLPET